MELWKLTAWKKIYPLSINIRRGLVLRCDTDVQQPIRRECRAFVAWLNANCFFPIRANIILKDKKDAKCSSVSFNIPIERYTEPYITIFTSYCASTDGVKNTICDIAYALSLYYQWINEVKLDQYEKEHQAHYFAKAVADEYRYDVYMQKNFKLWRSDAWKNYLPDDCRSGLRLVFDSAVESEARKACLDFAAWLRTEFYFPMRIPVYVKSARFIRALDGDEVYGTFFRTYDIADEPYARVAAGNYSELCESRGETSAQQAILGTIAHELTHYFQHINGTKLTPIGEERQATHYARMIIAEYFGDGNI